MSWFLFNKLFLIADIDEMLAWDKFENQSLVYLTWSIFVFCKTDCDCDWGTYLETTLEVPGAGKC
eukprot:scaffold2193_cov179-Ochromonas_danica.AAC.15